MLLDLDRSAKYTINYSIFLTSLQDPDSLDLEFEVT